MVSGAISIVEMVATQLPWSQVPPKENVTLKSCEQGLLIILNAPGFETRVVESTCGKRESYGGGWSYDQATVGYTPMHEKVKIPCGHLYDQDQPIGSQSASKVYTKMKENPEHCNKYSDGLYRALEQTILQNQYFLLTHIPLHYRGFYFSVHPIFITSLVDPLESR
ncbi:hypothetical protein Tco_0830645 [Tanacetum coccineum]